MISKVSPFFAKLRSTILAIFALSLVGVSVATDFIFRHEVKRQARKQLIADGLQPNVNGIIKAIREQKLGLFEQYEIAGISFGDADSAGMTPLHTAIETDDKDAIEMVMIQGNVEKSVDTPRKEDGLTPLMRVLNKRDFHLATRLIDHLGADVDTEKEPGLPYLIDALNNDDRELFDYLLSKGVDVNQKGEQPHSPLALAAEKDDLELMKGLVSKGASISTPGVSGKNLLLEAALESEYEEMNFLLSKGADIDVTDGESDILSLALDRQDGRMRAIAIDNGTNLNRNGLNGSPLIVEAYESGDHDWFLTLLEEGLSIESKNSKGDSLFMTAIKDLDYDMVDFLIEKGANVNVKDAKGLTPLQHAVEDGNTALVRTLVENKAEIYPEPMFAAAYRRRDNPTMNLLLNAGVDPELKLDGSDKRVMDVAVNEGAVDTVRILIDSGADIGDNLWGALLTGQDDLVKVILQNGGDPKQLGPKGGQPLEYALNNERFNLLKPLLDAGADPNPMYDQEESWVSRAIRTNNKDAAYHLIKAGAELGEGRAADGHSLLGWSVGHEMYDVTKALLDRGLDPNVIEPSPATDAFSNTFAKNSRTFRRALKYDSKVRPLMMAAVKKAHGVAQDLVKAGARNHGTRKHMSPVTIGAWHSDVRMMQICYGRNPDYQPRKVVVDLSRQRVTLYEDGKVTYSSVCSTGKPGYRTPPGQYVITQKNRHHVSSIYGSPMPYFMRVSWRDFGLHVGNCPGYPASHGCIRLPWSAAKHYFNKCSLGDLVIIQR